MNDKCDAKGIETNLTGEQKKGIEKLIGMQKQGDKVVSESDKSSKLVLNTLEGYTAMGEPHVSKDKVVTDKEVAAIERLMNGHTYQLCRILGVCTAWDDGKRVKGAMTNQNLPSPCLKLCYKDHKIGESGSLWSLQVPQWPGLTPALSPPQ